MNFSKLSSDGLQDLLTAKMQYSRELDAEREVLDDDIAEIEMVLSDRRERVAA